MQRTLKQNNALHKYYEAIAKVLNDAGLDMRVVLKPEVDIPWTTENVKNFLWRPVQLAYLGKKSTTELETDEVNKVYEVLTRHLGEKFGIFIEFPSIEALLKAQEEENL